MSDIEQIDIEDVQNPIITEPGINADYIDAKIITDKDGWLLTKEMSKSEDMSIYNAVLNRHKTLIIKTNDKKMEYLKCVETIKSWHILLAKECEKIDKKDKTEKKNKILPKTTSNINDYLVRANSSVQSTKKADKIKSKNIEREEYKQYEQLYSLLFDSPVCDSLNNQIVYLSIIEYIIIYYMHFVNKSYKYIKKQKDLDINIPLFFNSLFSVRDSYKDNSDLLEEAFKEQLNKFLEYYEKKVDYYVLIDNYSHYMFNNHYKNHFRHNIKLYKEQEYLLDKLEENDYTGIYILPWGIGCGKTSLVAPLSYLINSNSKKDTIFYCISKPPVKDQTAANMYRCGVPFAYIEQTGEHSYIVNPSYHCKNDIMPIIYIVQNQFIVDFINKNNDESSELSLTVPYHKRDYEHLKNLEKQLYMYNYSLIIDEPDGSDSNLLYILDNLPKLTILMSATSHGLINEKRIGKYMKKNSYIDRDKYINIIKMKDVKITTTLTSFWDDNQYILSPYTNCVNKHQLHMLTQLIEMDNIYKRFISPKVLIDLYNKLLKKKDYYKELDIELNLNELSIMDMKLDNIIYIVINFIKRLIKNNKVSDDIITELFKINKLRTKTEQHLYQELLETHTTLFTGGSLIGTSNIEKVYENIYKYKLVKDDIIDINDLYHKLDKYTKSVRDNIKRGLLSLKSEQIRLKKNEDDSYIASRRQAIYEKFAINKLPIENRYIINTKEFLNINDKTTTNTNYVIPLLCIEKGDKESHIEKWSYDLDTTLHVSQEKELCRLVGIGSINESNRLFYMKNIKDLNNGSLAYNISDSSGAFGLNLKIQSLILMDDIIKETTEVILQKIGRVGRPGQLCTGFVYLTDYNIFEKLFSDIFE